MLKLVELTPSMGQASYGHKAIVHFNDDGTKALYSYETKVCYGSADGFKGYRLTRAIYDPEKGKLRKTTMRHIADFLYQMGVYGEVPTSKQILKDFTEAIDN
jgi:hypothetical protein